MSITHTLNRIAAGMPASWQQEMKRAFFARQIRAGSFATDEVEFKISATGANGGIQYRSRLLMAPRKGSIGRATAS